MKFKIYSFLDADICIKTHFKHPFNHWYRIQLVNRKNTSYEHESFNVVPENLGGQLMLETITLLKISVGE